MIVDGLIINDDKSTCDIKNSNFIKYVGDIINIKISNNKSFKCHPDLKLLCLIKTSNDKSLSKRFLNSKMYKIDYVEAKNINILKHFIAYNIDDKVIHDDSINENRAKIIGYYTSEGWSNIKKQITIFTFSKKESTTLAEELKNLIKIEFNYDAKIKVHKVEDKTNVFVYNKDITTYLFKHGNRLSKNKKLSPEIVFAPDNIKLQYLTSWMNGDGSQDKYSKKLIGTSVSSDLIYQHFYMFNKLNMTCGIFDKISKEHISRGKKIKESIGFTIRIPYSDSDLIVNNSDKFDKDTNDINKKKIISFVENYRIMNIIGCNIEEFNGNLYNFKDSEFIINNISVKI